MNGKPPFVMIRLMDTPHMDRFYRNGRRVKKELHLNLKEALTLADEEIKDNWKAYQEAFMEGK